MSTITNRIAALSSEKRALLARRMHKKEQSQAQASIAPIPRDNNSFALSFTQERLWFLDQLAPGQSIYNLPTALRYEGNLNYAALTAALTEIVRRHETLRTTFVCDAHDQPWQQVNEPQPIDMPIVDLSMLPASAREAEAQEQAFHEAQQPFDLAHDALLRVKLLRLSATEHIHLITMHHIIADGWSSGVFVRELTALYASFTQHSDPVRACAAAHLPSLPIQYADFAVWQRQQLKGDVVDQQVAFWREQLADAPSLIELPVDRSRPPVQTANGTTYTIKLSPTLTDQLHMLSKQEGVTLFMTLLGAFNALLCRYTRQYDICVGSPIAGRNQAETHGLIGFFVNMVVMRTRLNSSMSVRELLQQVREVALGAYGNQDVPFEMIVERLQPERSLSYTPLFQVAFALQNAPMQPLQLTDITVHPPADRSGVAKYDLCLELTEVDGGITAVMEYNTDLFDRSTVGGMVTCYEALLSAMVAHPDQAVCTLPLLSDAARVRQLTDVNSAAAAPDLSRSAIATFEAHAATQPCAIAAQFGETYITYANLNQRANRFAHWLNEQDIGQGDTVGLFGNRGIAMLAAILAIYKIGAAYVPLDPLHPDARLATIMQVAQLKLVATQASLAERACELTQGVQPAPQVFCWETAPDDVAVPDGDILKTYIDTNLPARTEPTDLANVFFTSGSTGVPKGVMIEQIGMMNHLLAKIEVLGLTSNCVVAQTASHCFDISVWQFLAPLMVGGRVIIYDDDTAHDPEQLLHALQRDQITILETVPTLLDAMLQASIKSVSQTTRMPDLRYLISNAETLPVSLAQRWFEQFPHIPLVNTYGATECSDDTTHYVMHVAPAHNVSRVPVGQPVPGFRIYVLDDNLQLVPVGCVGQIAMAGVGVGRGYLGDDTKTSQAFVTSPFMESDGSRLYLTGDLGRWNTDNQLEFIGRMDYQVKVRGHRIELGEIEAALTRFPGIRQAVATVQADPHGQDCLAAYLVAEHVEHSMLRTFLQTLLPSYMLPEYIVVLDEFPINRNGKVDRQRLPTPDDTARTANTFVAPRTLTEEILCTIWGDVLHCTRIGVHDNFFEIGGHSLLATQIMSRVRSAFTIDLPLRSLFETPTIHGLAITLDGQRQYSMPYMPIQPIEHEGMLPTSFSQQRLWFLDQLDRGSSVYNMPTAVRLHGALDIAAIEHALSGIVEAHEVLRTTFVGVDGQPFQIVHSPEPIAISLVELPIASRDIQEAEALRLLTAAVQQPFDLAQRPLLRGMLLRFNPTEHVLLVVMHHIVTDGWSTSIMLDELARRYTACVQGQDHQITTPEIQYADFAAWQRTTFTDSVLAPHLDYWKTQLADADTVLNLPTDRPRPPVQTYTGAILTETVDTDVVQALHTLGRHEGATLFMTLLAAFEIVLYRYTGQTDFLIGTPIANRTQAEIEGLIGFFVNTLVLRTSFSHNPTVGDVIKQVRETALDAYAHQDTPFEMLVEHVQPERSLSHSPLFQVMFVLNNTPSLPAAFCNIQATPLANQGAVAKFDLTLAAAETTEGLSISVEYNTDLFDEATMYRLLDHYRMVLSAMVADLSQSIAHVPLLTAAEQQQVLTDFNLTTTAYPYELCVHQLFEQQATRTPDRIAVVAGDKQITYAELNAQANQFAHYLRDHEVGPEVVVGLCIDRSLALIIALLGVFKAGGAYLPLDPTYPTDRLAFMLSDSQASLLITQANLSALLPASVDHIMCIDTNWQTIAACSAENPTPTGDSSRLAYVIYTSGSTGVPKGVEIEQRSVVNVLNDMHERLNVDVIDTMLSITSLSFDISVVDLFLPLCYGAKLVLADRTVANDGFQLTELLIDSRSTIMQATPSAWRMMIQAGWSGSDDLRVGITGGEALTADLADQLIPRMHALWNFYGPTETTIWSTCQRVEVAEHAVLIGKPLANTAVYILDQLQQPVPVGVPGELYIAGDGMARGYLRRPELTAERFVDTDDTRWLPQHSRLYRTGDLVRHQRDGAIEYLGRMDHQVKIRGYRIELGEIEVALREHPELNNAVVVAREDTPGEKVLVAYVVPMHTTPTVDALRQYLHDLLPAYMVPDLFVPMETLPLTPNGKLDRKALPVPDHTRPDLALAYVAPRTAVEEHITAIWCEVLGLSCVGVEDNFFALGGHSIRATQLIARVNQAFHIDIPLRHLFEEPTIAALAAHVEAAKQIKCADVDERRDESDLIELIELLSEAEVEELLARKLGHAA